MLFIAKAEGKVLRGQLYVSALLLEIVPLRGGLIGQIKTKLIQWQNIWSCWCGVLSVPHQMGQLHLEMVNKLQSGII